MFNMVNMVASGACFTNVFSLPPSLPPSLPFLPPFFLPSLLSLPHSPWEAWMLIQRPSSHDKRGLARDHLEKFTKGEQEHTSALVYTGLHVQFAAFLRLRLSHA